MTPVTSSRTMYPNTNTTDLQCTLNNTGYNYLNYSNVLMHIYLFCMYVKSLILLSH